jgi:hypothetical protein
VWGRLFLDLWFYFEGRSSQGKIIKTMDEYSEFFRFTTHAYFVAYVIYMLPLIARERPSRTSASIQFTTPRVPI